MDEILASIRRIIAEDDRSGASGIGTIVPAPAHDEGILELTQAINADGSVRHLAATGSYASGAADMDDMPASVGFAPRDEPLVSAVASQRIAASLTRLAEVPEAQRAEPEVAAVGSPPLDEAAREMLRPMLQKWLDTNLPAIVERLVAAEIARLAGGAKPG